MLDLLLKKGNTHCSRPNLVVACELMDLIHVSEFYLDASHVLLYFPRALLLSHLEMLGSSTESFVTLH